MIPMLLNQLGKGLLAGALATAPMTAVMQLLHCWPYPERDSLPPHQITKRIAAELGIKKHLDRDQLTAVTLASHFGFGAVMGGLYALWSPRLSAPPLMKGLVWGMAVWTMAYLGGLPASNILPPATQHSRRRNFLMITAHLVWGASTALLAERFAGDEKR